MSSSSSNSNSQATEISGKDVEKIIEICNQLEVGFSVSSAEEIEIDRFEYKLIN